jgi:hypothetical protein
MARSVDEYIQLTRRFADYRSGEDIERDNGGFFYSSHLYAPRTWSDLLKHRCTVVVGTSGSGKSIEFRQKANSLRAANKMAFFCRLEDLANLPLASALEIGTHDELDEWLSTGEEGWFFLDAVDEARLASIRQFEHAINNFLEAIAPHRERIHALISTRPHAWEAYGDREMLCRKLDLRIADIEQDEDEADTQTGHVSETEETESSDELRTNPAPRQQELLHIVKLAPLGHDHIRIFAKARGVGDIERFMEEVEKANADVFANRPADLPGLIEDWKTKKRIGRYSDVVLQNISTKLKEVNPTHLHRAALSADRAVVGAERLAAAAVLCRKSSFLLPDRVSIDANVRGELIDPNDVLLDWRPPEVHELLGRGLFDEALYGSVRFHHRTAREYLTARWLRRLLVQQKHRRSIKRILFASPYGSERTVIVPSLKAVAAWLALWDQDIRDVVLHVDPKLLLEFGDASPLTIDIRASMIRNFAARYERQQHTPLELDIRELRRLADPRLVPAIREVFAKYRGHHDVRHLLLRLIREGKLQGCGDIALDIATDTGIDTYSRICAMQIISFGTHGEKEKLKEATLGSAASDERSILAALVHALYPTHLSIEEVVQFLASASHDRQSAYDDLQRAVIAAVEATDTDQDIVEFLRRIVQLVSMPPVIGEWCRISSRFGWLIPSAMAAAKVLLTRQPNGPFPIEVLSTIAMAVQSDHMRLYTGDVHKESIDLLRSNSPLRHAVFWHEAERRRVEEPGERLVDPWRVSMETSLQHVDVEEVPLLLRDLRDRALLDDKLIALARLIQVWARAGRPRDLMSEIKSSVGEASDLRAALEQHLNPPPPSPDYVASEQRMEQLEQEQRDRVASNTRHRREGIEYLKANVATLKIGDHAKDGRLLRNIEYLHSEIANKSKNSSRWAVGAWKQLEPEFGAEVARAFKDYCIGYWRLFRPQLRSEIGKDTNTTPTGVVIGLSGLMMEAAADREWATKLTADEAIQATRYALWELNQLPGWFGSLFAEHTNAVTRLLLGEMAWELSQPRASNSAGYVFSRLRWTSTSLGRALRDEIMVLLTNNPVADPIALAEALTVVLRNPEAIPAEFTNMIADRADLGGTEDVKALWLAGLLCVNAERAVPALEEWVNDGSDSGARERRLSLVLERVWGDTFHGLRPQHQAFRRADFLLKLIKLTHVHVDPEKDLVHDDVYTPDLRDHAEEARSQLLKILCSLPGRDTYRALLDLAEFHPRKYPKDRMRVLAEARAEADTEHTPWSSEDIQGFASAAEYGPRTQKELFELALGRLDDIKLELEEGDESEASVLRRVKDEPELRKVFANRLRRAAAGRYTTGSEEELADASRTDIRLHHPEVDARLPIELKIADARHWSPIKLRDMLEQQLTEQYMLESRYGIYLLVRRGGANDQSAFTLDGHDLSFEQLGDWLRAEGRELVRSNPSLDGLDIVTIDLTRRSVKGAAKPKGRRGSAGKTRGQTRKPAQ